MVQRPIAWYTVQVTLCTLVLLSACSNGTTTEGMATARGNSVGQANTNAAPAKLLDCALIKDEDFGGVYLDISIDDFGALGFSFGDGIDVAFSNGYTLNNIPYYNGYYAKSGDPQACGYPGYKHVMLNNSYGPSLWEQASLSESDTATVSLASAGEYLAVQKALSLTYTSKRSDYADDVAFANFRELSGGALREGLLYRSASPIDNKYNRAEYVNALSEDAGIRFVIDLADGDEDIASLAAKAEEQEIDVSHFLELYNGGNVAPLDLDANFMSPAFATTLAGGLRELTTHEGPYLINCLEGKDRTGFVCVLLESLAGATYDEILDDYMASYANYYGVTEEDDLESYDAIRNVKFDDIMRSFTHAEEEDLRKVDYAQAARAYLLVGGMTEDEIDHLAKKVCS